ncbi:hypothetical protein Gotur_018365 [Gossypium turneri]
MSGRAVIGGVVRNGTGDWGLVIIDS